MIFKLAIEAEIPRFPGSMPMHRDQAAWPAKRVTVRLAPQQQPRSANSLSNMAICIWRFCLRLRCCRERRLIASRLVRCIYFGGLTTIGVRVLCVNGKGMQDIAALKILIKNNEEINLS